MLYVQNKRAKLPWFAHLSFFLPQNVFQQIKFIEAIFVGHQEII